MSDPENRAEEYRILAKHCLEQAATIKDPDLRKEMGEIAQRYLQWAEEEDQKAQRKKPT